jgi:tetratricopeptide (TPR) repeat protein
MRVSIDEAPHDVRNLILYLPNWRRTLVGGKVQKFVMRTRLRSFIVLTLLPSFIIPMRAQQAKSLRDVAQRAHEPKQNVHGALLPKQAQPADEAAQSAPVTQMQLFSWLAGGLSTEDQLRELRARGIAFEPDEACLRDLAAAGDDALLISELRAAQRHLSVPPAQNAASAPTKNADSTPTQSALIQMVKVAMAVKKEDYRVALRLMTPLLQSDANNPDLLFALGNIFNEMEDWENASRAFARAVELAPQFPYGHGQLSLMHYQMGEAERAEAEAQAMLKLLPQSSDGHKFLGLALSAEDDDEGAFQEYAKALQLNPNNGMVYYDIGVLRAAQKDWEEAIVAYRRAIKIGPAHWYFYNNLGIALSRVGRVDEAIKAFDKGLELAPQNPELLQSYGALLCNSGRDEQAVELFTKLLAATPDWNMARPCLYRSLMRLGRADEAKQVKEDYTKYSPDHSPW